MTDENIKKAAELLREIDGHQADMKDLQRLINEHATKISEARAKIDNLKGLAPYVYPKYNFNYQNPVPAHLRWR